MKVPTQTQSPEHQTIRQPHARLRIIETTDLHMQLLPYDYFTDRSADHTGLVHLANQIATLRALPEVTTLLFDNGDFLQGNPLADYLATLPENSGTHPMIAAYNTLDYDAITLGNHEFNYGLQFLRDALKDAEFPVTCANIRYLRGQALAQSYVILDRPVLCDDGTSRILRIGVIGFVPPQITQWDKAALAGWIETDDIIECARARIPQIKAAGADIIVALCHSGIGAANHTKMMENAAVPLAALDGIDVIISGHSHEDFPKSNRAATAEIDPQKGMLHGKPAVMAGFCGNSLGVIDLELQFGNEGVKVIGQKVRIEHAKQAGQVESALQRTLRYQIQSSHDATIAHIRQPIAQTQIPLQSYFSGVRPDLPQQLLATAQARAATKALADTEYSELPVLSATAPFRFGGRAGPDHFIDIAPGPIALRDVAAIYPFTNALCAVRRTGAELRDWLEWAASHFNQIQTGRHDQQLINTQIPAYNFDTLFGLTYFFDLTQPARFAPDGTCEKPQASRVRNMRYKGQDIIDSDVFVVATNSYRTNGGGGYSGIPTKDILNSAPQSTRDILIEYLRTQSIINAAPLTPWTFIPFSDTSAIFQSAHAGRFHLSNGISHVGPDQDGFDLFRLTF